jgi:hypothetical protein
METSFNDVPARSRGPRRAAAVKKTKYIDSEDEGEKFSSDNDEEMTTNKGAGISDDSDFEPAEPEMDKEKLVE